MLILKQIKTKDERGYEQCDLALGKHTCLLEGKEVYIYPTVYKF